MNIRDGKIRFSCRANHYLKYRPDYPDKVIELLSRDLELTPGGAVADVGSGPGIFTQQLLNSGFEVFAVEPNHAMRDVACSMLVENEGFHSIAGSAEDTELPDRQVELVTAAQSFHWFDVEAARAEFRRISRPPHNVMLVWNHRQTSTATADSINHVVEEFLLRWCDDYEGIRSTYLDEGRVEEFFCGSGNYRCEVFENCQVLNWDSLEGRMKSCSYCPDEKDPRYIPMMCDLRQLFDQHQQSGRVRLCYETKVFLGQLK